MNRVLSVSKVAVVGGLLGLAVACHSEKIMGLSAYSLTNRPAEVAVGSRFDISLREGSSGAYATPPDISSPAVVFLGDEYPKQDPTPGGSIRIFHFRAAQAGAAAITLKPGFGPTIVDSIVVR